MIIKIDHMERIYFQFERVTINIFFFSTMRNNLLFLRRKLNTFYLSHLLLQLECCMASREAFVDILYAMYQMFGTKEKRNRTTNSGQSRDHVLYKSNCTLRNWSLQKKNQSTIHMSTCFEVTPPDLFLTFCRCRFVSYYLLRSYESWTRVEWLRGDKNEYIIWANQSHLRMSIWLMMIIVKHA